MLMSSKPIIFVDNREIRSEVPTALEHFGFDVQYLNLLVGDYVIGGNYIVGAERKDLGDYVGSLKSGHLNNQLVNMSHNFDYSILIIEGWKRGPESTGIAYESFWSSICGAFLKRAETGKRGSISIIPTETPFDTASILKYIYQRVSSGDMSRLPTLERASETSDVKLQELQQSLPNRQLHSLSIDMKLLCSFDGIGEKTAAEILKVHGSAGKLFKILLDTSIPVSDFPKVPGVGKATYNNLRSIIVEVAEATSEEEFQRKYSEITQ
jgi:ERCC4-type nuclease